VPGAFALRAAFRAVLLAKGGQRAEAKVVFVGVESVLLALPGGVESLAAAHVPQEGLVHVIAHPGVGVEKRGRVRGRANRKDLRRT